MSHMHKKLNEKRAFGSVDIFLEVGCGPSGDFEEDAIPDEFVTNCDTGPLGEVLRHTLPHENCDTAAQFA